ncbi:MAG: respiratory nitrate reductase subunit gamma, partial [Bacteroidales bacterium]
MTNFWDNTLFNYLPHVVIALLIFGIATRFVKASKTIQATSVQLLSKNKLYDMALLLFH